jgi:hypothetical protein
MDLILAQAFVSPSLCDGEGAGERGQRNYYHGAQSYPNPEA